MSAPEVERSRARALEDIVPVFFGTNVIAPPIAPSRLSFLYHHSTEVRKHIDTLSHNVDGCGWDLVPVVDLKDDEEIAEAIFIEWERQSREQPGAADVLARKAAGIEWPAPEYVAKRKKQLELDFRKEKAWLKIFFAKCSPGKSFIATRKQLRADLETYGYAFLEVLRDVDGDVREFVNLRAWTVGICPLSHFVPVRERVRTGPLGFETIDAERRFHLFVQDLPGMGLMGGGKGWMRTFFKEFEDPRTISAETGETYLCANQVATDELDAQGLPVKHCATWDAEEKRCPVCTPKGRAAPSELPDTHRAASELVHFSIYAQTNVYGLPRWFGAYLEALISRELTERDWGVLINSSMPDLAVVSEGGVIPDAQQKQWEDHMEARHKGSRNAGRTYFLGLPAEAGLPIPKIRLEVLAKAALSAGELGKLKEANGDLIREQFGFGPTLGGKQIGSNRATADAEMEKAETQVFAPLRTDFDDWVNLMLLHIGARFHTFKSRGPRVKDDLARAEILDRLANHDLVNKADVKQDLREILGHDLAPDSDKAPSDLPTRILVELIKAGAAAAAKPPADAQGTAPGSQAPAAAAASMGAVASNPEAFAHALIMVRDALQKMAAERQSQLFAAAERPRVDAEPEHVAGIPVGATV